jgi:hypothetical protein
MASDPLHPGLGELGQRLQALGDPVAEPVRLRPYQGGAAQGGSVQAGSAPGKAASPPSERPAQPAYAGWHSVPTPAPPEPYTDLPQHSASTNGYSHVAGTTTAAEAASASTPSASSAAAPAAPGPAAASADPAVPSGIQRAINAVRNTLPLVQRLLPLLEGNIATAATAITALVAPQPTIQHIHPPAPPAPTPSPAPVPVPIDLGPIERSLGEVDRGLVEVRNSHRELKTQVAEHVTAFKRVEDQLDHVREATDRNTLEQQELVEDLRAVGSRVSTFAIIGLVLLVLSLLLNGYLIFQMQRILH